MSHDYADLLGHRGWTIDGETVAVVVESVVDLVPLVKVAIECDEEAVVAIADASDSFLSIEIRIPGGEIQPLLDYLKADSEAMS